MPPNRSVDRKQGNQGDEATPELKSGSVHYSPSELPIARCALPAVGPLRVPPDVSFHLAEGLSSHSRSVSVPACGQLQSSQREPSI
jgi:hypothetical protein